MNYVNTFIAVAADTKVETGMVPPSREDKKSVAQLEYELIAAKPYQLTQEDVQFEVYVQRTGLNNQEVTPNRSALWAEFFSKSMACMRASPLPKSYGWGLHFDADGKVALIGVETEKYARLVNDPTLEHTAAMRSKRS
jgi:predicted transcriptional regulator YdeE